MSTKQLSKGDMIKWAFNIIIPLCIALIPCNDVFTMQMKLFFVSTVFAILTFAFETVDQTVISIALPLFWIFFKVAEPAVALQPWTQYIPWMMLSGLILANALESSGLLARISYWCLVKTGGTYKGIVWGVALAAAFLTLFVGNVIVPMAALTYGICRALDTGKSKASAGIMLTAAMGCLILNCTKMQGPVLMMGIGQSVTGPLEFLGYFESFYVNAPVFLEYIVLVFLATKFFKPEKQIAGKEFFRQKLTEMGKVSINEIKCAFVLIVFLLFILTKNIHGMSLEWGLAIVPMLVCVPGLGCATKKDIQRVNYGFILFITACMGIGAVAGSLGLGKIMVNAIMPILQGKSYYIFFLIEWVTLVVMNFVMTPLAMEAAFTIPFATLGTSMGLNPMAIYYFMMNGVDQIILPYQYALYMIFFAFGLIHVQDFMKMMASKMVVNFIMVFGLLLTWWKIIGFLFV